LVPVTLVLVETVEIVQVKTVEKDHYQAVVLGAEKLKHPSKNHHFHLVKEFKVEELAGVERGQTLGIETLEGVESVTVSAVSKGKGFQGCVVRHNFSIHPHSHGHKHIRAPGSIGVRKARRTQRGQRLPGHMGAERVTLKDRPIVQVDVANKLVAIKGPIPGAMRSPIELKW